MDFPVLYRKDKNDGIREWSIQVIHPSDIITFSGLKGGKMIKTTEHIKSGKNIGRANETSPLEQAISEAQSKWNKKVLSGYSERLGSTNKKAFGAMLAYDYVKKGKRINLPALVQPKLDGYRALYNKEKDKIISRGNKEYEVLYGGPLHEEMKKFNYNLDGELYTHDKDYMFENYGILRKKKLSPTDKQKINLIKYYVYDIIEEGSNQERFDKLKKDFNRVKPKNIILVDTYLVNDKSQIENLHAKFIKEGYEGTIIRNSKAEYINKRTSDLLKYKNFDDAEFKIIGYTHEKDTKGDKLLPIIFVCVNNEGLEFSVPTKGTRDDRHKMYKNGDKYIGKYLTVQFFGYTENGVPRFPKALRDNDAGIRNKNY